MTKRLLVAVLFLIAACLAQRLQALQMAQAGLEQLASAQGDTPQPSPSPTATPAVRTYTSTVANSEDFVPLTVRGKFHYFAVESFRPGIYPVAAVYTAYTMANPPSAYPPKWRDGFPAFARNYGDFMASWVSVQGGKFVVASLIHEDPRYFPSHSRNFFARSFNAIRFAVIDRSDQGHPRLAVANLSGALAGGYVGNAYLPAPYVDERHALRRSALALSGFATSNLVDEFWPEVTRVAKKLHVPYLGK